MQAWILTHPQKLNQAGSHPTGSPDGAAPLQLAPLQLMEVPTPQPGAGEVLVRVRACGICRTDLHVVEGELPVRRPRITPGHQIVGEIVGDGGGQRVGVAWLHHTDGTCGFCRSGRENLCDHAEFTGWTVPGGFAEYVVAARDFVYPLPEALSDAQAAPLLCAGIIGYRCLRLCGLGAPEGGRWAGARLGIYGFGAAGHIALQMARARGAEVYVCTRDHDRHQRLAQELGAAWVGGAAARPPVRLDAAVMFAPAGELVPAALQALDKGGVLVLGGIHMSPIPQLQYAWIYGERVICSVANNTRADGREFLDEASRIGVQTRVTEFSFGQLPEALRQLKYDGFAGAGVLMVSPT